MESASPPPGGELVRQYAAEIVVTIREPLLVLDADLRVKVANRAFYQTFKVPSEQTLDRLIYELGDGQWDIPALRKLLDELLPTNGHFDDYQVEHDFPGIGQRTMLLNARRLQGEDNQTKLILLAIEDITERRHAELEVARQRNWFATTLSSIGDAVIATDADARVTFLNPTAEVLTGWNQQQATGKPLAEVFNIVNEETRNLVESPVSKAIRAGTIVGLANHTLLIARDGSERAIDDSAAPIRDEAEAEGGDGKIVGVVLVFRDITERRAAEQRLEASEKSYRRLFESAHDGILILDAASARITDVNPFLLEIMDYPREHFIGKELWEIGLFQHKEENQAAMRQLQQTGSIRYENLPLRRRDGHTLPVEFVSNVYHENQHSVIQCNIRDISERKAREAQIEAEEANRAKDVFLATLSHELRTPLNAILGWAVLLRQGKLSGEELREAAEAIERCTHDQARLIEDVLDISRIVSGKLRLEVRPCDLTQVIENALKSVAASAEAKQIHIERNLDLSASAALCDPARIQQVIWNLLSNAVKFTDKGGWIKVELKREGSVCRITISDSGQGISPDFLPHVFERFHQADSSRRRQHGGLGLGLSIVRQLVELHGGTVRAESPGPGRGSTFTVEIPIRAVRIVEEEAPGVSQASDEKDKVSPAKGVRLEGLRLLVVDDEADARRVIKLALELAGATVQAVGSVAEALEALPKVHPQILISDLSMPGQDGYDLIHQVRGRGRDAKKEKGLMANQLPAIALTAFARKEERQRALLAGFQVHLSKPVDPDELIATVAALADVIKR